MSKVHHMRQMRQRIQRLQGDPSGTDHRRLYGFKKENIRHLATLFVGTQSNDYLTSTEKIKLCLQFLTDPGVDTKTDSTRVINTTISNIISGTISNIVAKAYLWISFPQTPEELLDAKKIWRAEHSFPNAVGVVGAIRVRLQKCQIYGDEYESSDGEHTFKVLATCDGKGIFNSVDARWPGSANESLMWSNSKTRDIMLNSADAVLVADERYDKESCLLTPFQIPETTSQLIFNEILIKERIAIDKSFEQLKRRFRILNCTFCLKPKAIREIIIACFVLHNIALRMGEEDMPDYKVPFAPEHVLLGPEGVSSINSQQAVDCKAPIIQSTECVSSSNSPKAADIKNHITLSNVLQNTEGASRKNTLKAGGKAPIDHGNVLQNGEASKHRNTHQAADAKALIAPEKSSIFQTAANKSFLKNGDSFQNAKKATSKNTHQAPVHVGHAKQNHSSDIISLDKVHVLKCQVIRNPRQMMSNSGATFGNGIQQHNLTSAIDYINQNGPATLAAYPSVTTTDPGLVLDKQPSATYFAAQPNPQAFYSTQLVRQAPGTILITNNFGPDESSTISGVNNNFNNSSIRIVTHNNNNNSNHTNNNNSKTVLLDDANCKIIADKQQPQQKQPQQQHYHQLHHLHHQSSPVALPITLPASTSPPNPVKIPNSLVSTTAPVPTTTSTVVLDRINICINNHYGDATTMTTPTVVPPQSGSLPSPIIPPVIMSQHTTIVETLAPLCTPSIKPLKSCDTEMHVDEPDSTTPANCHSDLVAPMEQDQDLSQEQDKSNSFDEFPIQKFEIGDDALVKRRDGRYYLGTVVDVHRQQYLVQFDDKTDYWSNVDELLKLSTDVVSKEKASCLACKRDNDDDVVEICERCGRGYHRGCTDEVTSKSGEWMCKRCVKPMKLSAEDDVEEKPRFQKIIKADIKKFNKQFPYALDSLTWDEKHRVNDEHIYCYCGKSGQFDNNMIQCCKCKQWFHVHCVGCVKTLFRGDVFFIFGCSVCNDGTEFLRRVEMEWTDLVHLVLYNMAIMKNFQKYHHLHKEIYPFALEKRPVLQLPLSMLSLSDNDFKANILKTLQAHPTLFQCGKEIKKDHAFWGLRANKPPQGPTYEVGRSELLCNQLIREKLKIKILPYGEEDDPRWVSSIDDGDDERLAVDTDKHIPEVKTELIAKQDQVDDDDDKFTSDDEIPIKLIIEKVKALTSPVDESEEIKPSLQDDSGISDQSNDNPDNPTDEKEKPEEKNDMPVLKPQQKNSRKRKAFTLSKGYKELDKSNDSPRNICDSSSDENSSSSRGTLDLIIPPPKNFLGINNPFRMLTPKKSDNNTSAVSKKTGSNYTKKTVSFGSNSIFTNTLDLNSKIAALKSSGLLPNISNSDMAKAAGQPRLVRTIKRRLSAKDIRIGPNQEVRRRRTRPLSSNVEVISTTTINSIPSNFFPIRTTIPEATNSSKSQQTNSQSNPSSSALNSTSASTSNADSIPPASVTSYGRRLRKRPERTSPQNSRRNSICSSSSNSSTGAAATQLAPPPPSSSQSQSTVSMCDLKQSVNKYFGAANRIENGENFTIRAKRRLTNGQMQYLIEWES